MSQQIKVDQITECLTESCLDCSGSYINKLTGYQLKCNCKCHNKKNVRTVNVIQSNLDSQDEEQN